MCVTAPHIYVAPLTSPSTSVLAPSFEPHNLASQGRKLRQGQGHVQLVLRGARASLLSPSPPTRPCLPASWQPLASARSSHLPCKLARSSQTEATLPVLPLRSAPRCVHSRRRVRARRFSLGTDHLPTGKGSGRTLIPGASPGTLRGPRHPSEKSSSEGPAEPVKEAPGEYSAQPGMCTQPPHRGRGAGCPGDRSCPAVAGGTSRGRKARSPWPCRGPPLLGKSTLAQGWEQIRTMTLPCSGSPTLTAVLTADGQGSCSCVHCSHRPTAQGHTGAFPS